MLELTITPAGDVTMCRVVSSELKDPELERKIVALVRTYRFEAKDVDTITVTKPHRILPLLAPEGQPRGPVMNLNSEIQFYAELRLVDKARLLNLFLRELAEEARGTYGPGAEQVHDAAHLRFVNELYHRLTRVIEQLLAEEADAAGR